MKELTEFFNMFFTTDYLLIILTVLLVIILVITMYLIRLQKEYSIDRDKRVTEDKGTLEDDLSKLTLNFGGENKSIKNELDEEKNNYFNDLLFKSKEEEIKNYESIEEENAIISTEELERVHKARSEAAGNIDNSNLINKYEEEQEKKAIISYEELLKNASGLKINYKEEKTLENGPTVRKVEIETPEIERVVNYNIETEFLAKMKEFRANLE